MSAYISVLSSTDAYFLALILGTFNKLFSDNNRLFSLHLCKEPTYPRDEHPSNRFGLVWFQMLYPLKVSGATFLRYQPYRMSRCLNS